MADYEKRIEELGLEIPPVPKPVAAYIPALQVGNLVFCSGQGPMADGRFVHIGQVGADLTVEQGYEAARLCALNCLAAVKSVIGSLNRVDRIVHVRGFVNSAPGFEEQPEVINGASELLQQIFGERGQHARAALGTSALPRNIAVELEMIVSVSAEASA
ncbi:MAG: RidA family protein [Candidatus Bipolaricaulia bacterium]